MNLVKHTDPQRLNSHALWFVYHWWKTSSGGLPFPWDHSFCTSAFIYSGGLWLLQLQSLYDFYFDEQPLLYNQFPGSSHRTTTIPLTPVNMIDILVDYHSLNTGSVDYS